MTVTELIAALADKDPDSEVTVAVGSTQIDEFVVEVDDAGAVVLRGQGSQPEV